MMASPIVVLPAFERYLLHKVALYPDGVHFVQGSSMALNSVVVAWVYPRLKRWMTRS
jgi:hypothetical protein